MKALNKVVCVCVCVNVLCLSPAAGPTVKPSVSLLPPSSLQISGDSAALLCLLSSYSPQGALVSWTLDGSEVTEGVLTSAESQQDGRYSRSSVLTLSKARWEEGELYVCRVTHDGAPHEVSDLQLNTERVCVCVCVCQHSIKLLNKFTLCLTTSFN
ncbi:hypothetical protein PO909_021123 [Leuciscus waleckii]